jgi:hypothetical protein
MSRWLKRSLFVGGTLFCGVHAATDCVLTLHPVSIFAYRTPSCAGTELDSVQSLVPERHAADFSDYSVTCLNQTIQQHTGLGVARVQLGSINDDVPLNKYVDVGPVHYDLGDLPGAKSFELWFSLNQSLPYGEYVLFQTSPSSEQAASPQPRISYVKYRGYCPSRAFEVETEELGLVSVNLVDLQAEFGWTNDRFEQDGHDAVHSLTVILIENTIRLCFAQLSPTVSDTVSCLNATQSLADIRLPGFSTELDPNEYPAALYYQAIYQDVLTDDQVQTLVHQTPFASLARDEIQMYRTQTLFDIV